MIFKAAYRSVPSVLSLASLLALFIAFAYSQEKPIKDSYSEKEIAFCVKNDLIKYAEKAAKWRTDVERMVQENSQDGDEQDILCLGSSSFRLWDTINKDMAPYKMLRRAYGGAKYCDLAIHTPKLIHGLKYRAVLIFVGNDITGSDADKTPDEIVRLSNVVIASIRSDKPSVPIFLIAITPTPSRFQHWPKIQEANRALEASAKSQANTFFIKTEDRYLTSSGESKPELFRKDMLHQNQQGYDIWAGILKQSLASHLQSAPIQAKN